MLEGDRGAFVRNILCIRNTTRYIYLVGHFCSPVIPKLTMYILVLVRWVTRKALGRPHNSQDSDS